MHPTTVLYIGALPEFLKKYIIFVHIFSVFVFTQLQCLQICAHVLFDRPQNCTQILFRSRAGLCSNFGRLHVKMCPIFYRLRTKLCSNFRRSHTRLCLIFFAPSLFLPNLAGTLNNEITSAQHTVNKKHVQIYSHKNAYIYR